MSDKGKTHSKHIDENGVCTNCGSTQEECDKEKRESCSK